MVLKKLRTYNKDTFLAPCFSCKFRGPRIPSIKTASPCYLCLKKLLQWANLEDRPGGWAGVFGVAPPWCPWALAAAASASSFLRRSSSWWKESGSEASQSSFETTSKACNEKCHAIKKHIVSCKFTTASKPTRQKGLQTNCFPMLSML